MKFGKSLSNQIDETLPEWRDKFLYNKDLKKSLKLIKPQGGDGPASKRQRLAAAGEDCTDTAGVTTEEIDFINLLEDELQKFNTFFIEKEEEYIIRLKDLQDRVAEAKESDEEMVDIRKEIVDFHGEMILLVNYSSLNYTGMVKILKKYDKRTGALLRLPFIQKVLQQPFFTTDLLYKLVKECETMLDHLFPVIEPPDFSEAVNGDEPSTSASNDNNALFRSPEELAVIDTMENNLYMKSSISALRVLTEIRSGSSTVSFFSLPPLQIGR